MAIPVFDSSVVGSRKAESVVVVVVVLEDSGKGSSLERMEEETVTQAKRVPNDGTNSESEAEKLNETRLGQAVRSKTG